MASKWSDIIKDPLFPKDEEGQSKLKLRYWENVIKKDPSFPVDSMEQEKLRVRFFGVSVSSGTTPVATIPGTSPAAPPTINNVPTVAPSPSTPELYYPSMAGGPEDKSTVETVKKLRVVPTEKIPVGFGLQDLFDWAATETGGTYKPTRNAQGEIIGLDAISPELGRFMNDISNTLNALSNAPQNTVLRFLAKKFPGMGIGEGNDFLSMVFSSFSVGDMQYIGSAIKHVLGKIPSIGEKGLAPQDVTPKGPDVEAGVGKPPVTPEEGIKPPVTPEEGIKPPVAQPQVKGQETTVQGDQGKTSSNLSPIEGTGEIKNRGLSVGVEEKAMYKHVLAIEDNLIQGFGDLPQYKQVSMKDQAIKAVDLMTKDYEQAKRIAMGDELAPQNLFPESVFVAVENRAIQEGDVVTLKNLATVSKLTTEATTMGQRIVTLRERNAESPVGAMQDVLNKRTTAVQEKLKVKDLTETKTKMKVAIKSEINKLIPNQGAWATFIDSITC